MLQISNSFHQPRACVRVRGRSSNTTQLDSHFSQIVSSVVSFKKNVEKEKVFTSRYIIVQLVEVIAVPLVRWISLKPVTATVEIKNKIPPPCGPIWILLHRPT